jgi:hypothetical protein
LVYLIVIGNYAEVKPSAIAVIVTVHGLFLAPIIARAKLFFAPNPTNVSEMVI